VTARRTIFVGGGGYCRELLLLAADCCRAGTLPPVAGYLDDNGDVLAPFDTGVPWLGSLEDYVPQPGDGFILALGTPSTKRAVHEKLRTRGGIFPRLIHPSANIAPSAGIEEGVIFGLLTAAGPNTQTERFVTFNNGSGIGHDCTVGAYTTLSANIDVTGSAVIGSGVMIGTKAVILPRVTVGDGATIGAGSIVYRSIPAGATVYAPPAKLLKLGRGAGATTPNDSAG
jgi:sugar O-acyltransferase (sialic acid O-acetyltransferase NeuD family)